MQDTTAIEVTLVTAPTVASSFTAFCQMHKAVMTAITAKRWPNSAPAPLPTKANSPTSCRLVQQPVLAHTATTSSSPIAPLATALSALSIRRSKKLSDEIVVNDKKTPRTAVPHLYIP